MLHDVPQELSATTYYNCSPVEVYRQPLSVLKPIPSNITAFYVPHAPLYVVHFLSTKKKNQKLQKMCGKVIAQHRVETLYS